MVFFFLNQFYLVFSLLEATTIVIIMIIIAIYVTLNARKFVVRKGVCNVPRVYNITWRAYAYPAIKPELYAKCDVQTMK